MRKFYLFIFLLLSSFGIFGQCAGEMSSDFFPEPSPDMTFPPNTQIELCVTMTGWEGNSQGFNWLIGFGIDIVSGVSSIQETNPPQPPFDADTQNGTWGWYNSVTSSVNPNLTVGPGYFFETSSGNPLFVEDDDPGNNYGDYCPNADCIWQFCIILTTSNNGGEPIILNITPYSDGTMGNYQNNPDCDDEEPYVINFGSVECNEGCTDPVACNFNPNASCNDGSCTFPGCTDPVACNYDLNAACDDGSCTYGGCINPLACNFNPIAGCDDGSCSYFSMGDITHNLIPCPDTVCTGLESNYSVTGNQSSIYDWHITGGGFVTTDQTNDCEIVWGNIPGTYTISVQEITDAGCEGVVKTCDVEVVVPDIIFDTTKYTMCLNSSVELGAQPLGGEWSSDYMNGNTFVGTNSGTYHPSYLTNIYGCDIQEEVEVVVKRKYEAPNIIYSSEIINLCQYPALQTYIAEDSIGYTYNWFIDDVRQGSTQNYIEIEWPDTTRTYIVKVIAYDEIGCESEPKLVSVRIETCQRFFAPNSFTPNGDGINDVFIISGLSVYQPNLTIFNRWGVEVYVSSNLYWTGDGGNGYYCDNGVYNWIIEYKDKLGQNRQESGHVTLIR